MTYTRPCRLMILHFGQRRLTDAETFTVHLVLLCYVRHSHLTWRANPTYMRHAGRKALNRMLVELS